MTLQTLKKIKKAVRERPQELADARKKGAKVVGWFGYNIPEELIHALGLIPVRLGIGGDDKLVTIGGEYLTPNTCVFARETVGLFAEKNDPYVTNSDIVAGDTTCLGTYRILEVLKYYFKIKTLILGVPKSLYLPEGRKYFEKELEFFTHNLEEIAGNKLDKNKLAESIKLYNNIRKTIKKLYEYQSAANPQIKWREVFDVMHAGYYLDRERYLSLLQELLKELNEKQGNPVIEKQNGDVRIFLSGSIIPPKDTKLIDIIEKNGTRIVGDDLWSGRNSVLNIEIKEPSIKGIADAYINRVPHSATPWLDLETDKRVIDLKQLIHDHGANGVIYQTLRFCDPYSFKTNEVKTALDEIPLLEIHTEYAGSDTEAIKTRVEAFVEMITNKNSLKVA